MLKDRTNPPPLRARFSNFAQSAVRHALTGFKTRSDEEAQQCLNVCRKCEYLKKKTCLKCGCLVETAVTWQSKHCPINKW